MVISHSPLQRILTSQFLWGFVVTLTAVVYTVGIFIDIMEIDAAVYAHISMEMAESGRWLETIYKGTDWLDKPHFQFWITAVSFKLFGYNNFAYKIPAVLFLLVGILYTYRYGKRFYSPKTGAIAALMLMTAQHIIMSNHDVRAEPYLTGLTIFSLYYWASYLDDKRKMHFVAGCAGLAFLMMTKGLFTILPIAGGVFFSLVYQKNWKEIFHWQWLLAAFIVVLLMSPTLVGYYLQFDMHPEKEMFGTTGVSGIRFFFWDSQWGRFANTGPIRGSGDPAFFLHSLLWVYAPWSIIGYYALYRRSRSLIRREQPPENYTYFGFIFLFLIFSMSSFQLPHYLNPTLPLLAVLSASALLELKHAKSSLRILNAFQVLFVALGVLVMVFVQAVYFSRAPHVDTLVLLVLSALLIALIYVSNVSLLRKIVFAPAIGILALNYYLSREFYSDLTRYQSETAVLNTLRALDIDPSTLVAYDSRAIATGFYTATVIPEVPYDTQHLSRLKGKYVFTSERGLEQLKAWGIPVKVIAQYEDFRITTLNYAFVNKKTREDAVDETYLVKTAD